MKDPISRTWGGDVQLFAPQYDAYLDESDELTKYQLTPVDVINAIKAQNARVAAGQLGGTPPVKAVQLNASITPKRVRPTTDEFGKIPLKVNQDGSGSSAGCAKTASRVHDVIAKFNGQPASGGLGIKLATGANALGYRVTAIRAELKKWNRSSRQDENRSPATPRRS